MTLPPGPTNLGYDAVVRVSDDPDEVDASAQEIAPDRLPDHVLAFTVPSRFCLSDVLGDVAWSEFGGLAPGYSRVQSVCDFVHDRLRFDYGAASPFATALGVYQARAGVCRDFATSAGRVASTVVTYSFRWKIAISGRVCAWYADNLTASASGLSSARARRVPWQTSQTSSRCGRCAIRL